MKAKKYSQGGTIDPTKLSPEKRREYLRKLTAELNAAKGSRYASVEDKKKDIAQLEKKIVAVKKAGSTTTKS